MTEVIHNRWLNYFIDAKNSQKRRNKKDWIEHLLVYWYSNFKIQNVFAIQKSHIYDFYSSIKTSF